MLEGIQMNSRTIESLIIYQVNKFKNGADVTKLLGGKSRHSTSTQKKNQILQPLTHLLLPSSSVLKFVYLVDNQTLNSPRVHLNTF